MKTAAASSQAEVLSPAKSDFFAALAKRPTLISLFLVLSVVALYYPAHVHPFVKYDDNDYVFENRQVQSGLSWNTVKWACTTSAASNWHPLTWLSHALDCQLFGLNPAGPHDINVLLHALNAALLFWVLLRATGAAGRSFMVSALFGLHPINVESVVWIAERKNVLSMLFFLLALGAYQWYTREPRIGRYSLVALLFALGLMAKPQIITFPFVLLLWDYWPLERIDFGVSRQGPRKSSPKDVRRKGWLTLVVEKIPLFLLAAASAAITLRVQHEARNWFPRLSRLGNGILAYGLYVKKSLWPSGLAPLYPHPGIYLNWWKVMASALVLSGITILVIVKRRHRYLPVGWFWFLGTLIPMIGIVQVGIQAMADRYAYLSFIGLFLMICWAVADCAKQQRLPAAVLPAVSLVVLSALTVTARHQIDYWQTDEALWRHTLQVTSRNWVAESQLGAALAVEGRIGEAMPHFYAAIAIQPYDSVANMGIAIDLLQRGNFRAAVFYYNNVVRDQYGKPGVLTQAYIGMAKAYRALGETAKSQECLKAARKVGGE